MRMAYNQNGQLIVDHGLGWSQPTSAPALGDDGGCGCGRRTDGALGQAQTGSAFVPLALALGGLWAVSALLGGRR